MRITFCSTGQRVLYEKSLQLEDLLEKQYLQDPVSETKYNNYTYMHNTVIRTYISCLQKLLFIGLSTRYYHVARNLRIIIHLIAQN